ncbi:MAG: cobalt ECF transporter T component CbiQ [Deltaproteobacteria bacterium]|nr:cobalt ECF transporter T component CbiQ [Deltaproteobacteria bacterium]
MFDLFLDFFANRDNHLTRMDSRTKMIVASSLILAVILSTKIILPLIVLAVCVSIMLIIGIPAKLVFLRLIAPMSIVLALVVVQTFSVNGTGFFSVSLFGLHLVATHEGLTHGIMLGSRVLGAVSVMILLGSVTPAHKIFHALRWFKVPDTWVEIALLIYRYTFTLADQTTDIAEAQKLRLGYSSLRRSLSSIGVLAGTVITRSMDQAMRTYEAMTLRGYNGAMRFEALPKMPKTEFMGLLIVLPLIIATYCAVEWWPK